MTLPSPKRPAAVTIIGLSFLSFSILVILYGSVSIISLGLGWLKHVVNAEWYVPPEEFPPVLLVVFDNFKAFELLTLVRIVLAALLLVVAIAFLSLKAWARTALEIVSWTGLCYTGIQALAWPFVWFRVFAHVKSPGFGWYGPFTLMAGVVVLVASIISLVFVIRALRRPAVRAAMRTG